MKHHCRVGIAHQRHRIWWAMPALLAALLIPAVADACDVPVFRYALERWRPDPYEAFVVYRGELTEQQKELLAQLEELQNDEENPLNLIAREFNLDTAKDKEIKALFGDADPPSDLPKLILKYPYYYPTNRSAWEGELTAASVEAIKDSPVRRELIKRILDGESGIWLLIECGDKKKDDAAAAMIAEQLKANQAELDLPEQDVLQADEFFKPETMVKLRLAFSMVRVSRDDTAERVLLSSLLNSEDDMPADQPIVIPIYGRGRSYYAAIGKGINEDIIGGDCRFLSGPCSCQVKLENPGVDLLFAVDWDRHLTASAFREVELPALTGIGGLVEEANAEPQEPADGDADSEIDPAADAETDPAEAATNPGEQQTSRPVAVDTEPPAEDQVAMIAAPTVPPSPASGSTHVAPPRPEDSAAAQPASAEVSSDSVRLPLWLPIAGILVLGVFFVGIGTSMMKKDSH